MIAEQASWPIPAKIAASFVRQESQVQGHATSCRYSAGRSKYTCRFSSGRTVTLWRVSACQYDTVFRGRISPFATTC